MKQEIKVRQTNDINCRKLTQYMQWNAYSWKRKWTILIVISASKNGKQIYISKFCQCPFKAIYTILVHLVPTWMQLCKCTGQCKGFKDRVHHPWGLTGKERHYFLSVMDVKMAGEWFKVHHYSTCSRIEYYTVEPNILSELTHSFFTCFTINKYARNICST